MVPMGLSGGLNEVIFVTGLSLSFIGLWPGAEQSRALPSGLPTVHWGGGALIQVTWPIAAQSGQNERLALFPPVTQLLTGHWGKGLGDGDPVLPTTHRQGWGQSDCVARDPGVQRLEQAAPRPRHLSAEAWC